MVRLKHTALPLIVVLALVSGCAKKVPEQSAPEPIVVPPTVTTTKPVDAARIIGADDTPNEWLSTGQTCLL